VNASEAERNLAWKLNWWRQSELEGALLLGRLVGMVEGADLAIRLTRHCAEEAEHSLIWAKAIAELDLPHVRISSLLSILLPSPQRPSCQSARRALLHSSF
jgi:hypothetical protein